MTDGTQDRTLVELISRALEQRERGVEPRLEELCAGHSNLIPAVAEALGLASELPSLQATTSADESLRGRVLAGRYELRQRLGAGSMGVVYSAVDRELGRDVAVKVLRTDFLSGSEAEMRFAREAEVLAAIRHESVVTIHDRGRTREGGLFLVMELLDGASLTEVLEDAVKTAEQRGGVQELDDLGWLRSLIGKDAAVDHSYLRTAVGWCATLADALQAAHEAGVLHRDVKPSNVFVTPNGSSMLLDFGIAASVQHDTVADGTRTLGTPAYMAPEQLERERLSPAVDVYGLAAMLYHLVALRAPYDGTPSQILARLQREDPMPIRKLRKDLPRDLEAILDRGMARDPAARYASAKELSADLHAFLAHRPVQARPISAAQRTWRRARRSPVFRTAAAMTLLAALGVTGYAVWQHRQSERWTLWRSIWAKLPPALTLWNQRTLQGSRYEVTRALLDNATATGVAVTPTRVVRAAFRLDHGDADGAARDMAAVADDLGTPLARELARRYAALAEAPARIEVADLPDPTHARDIYLAGFHLLRAGKGGEAREVLGSEGAATYAPARELWLALRIPLVRRLPRTEGLELARSIHEDALKLEATSGRTAMTAHLVAAALITGERYKDAKQPLADGIELSAIGYHGLHSNAAVVARRTDELDKAIEQCHTALAINPRAAKAHETLVAIHIAKRDETAAMQALEDATVPRSVLTRLRARVGFLRAFNAWKRNETDTARRAAKRAARLFAAVRDTRDCEAESAFCRAVAEGSDLFSAMLAAAGKDLSNWNLVPNLVIPNLPTSLDEDQTTALRRFLDSWWRHQLENPR